MMNLADPELELIDPTPNVHTLFVHFDKLFFWARLASRAVVRWSKRMYSCAGICSYEGRGGVCDIALSEPLLKLRPRKDLVETLLHEMIHAYLFITDRDQDRDGHGPNFKAHMHRINRSAGLNISIYHDFHDEVKLYQTHVWRCNGPCQSRKPFFGIVRRAMNRTPGPSDCWWTDHKRKCGGTFIKIKEPEKAPKKSAKVPVKPKGTTEITKYINNNNKNVNNNNLPKVNNNNNIMSNVHEMKTVLKDSSNVNFTKTKSNRSNTLVITKKDPIYNPEHIKPVQKPVTFSGSGYPTNGIRNRTNSVGVLETVRNIWANKQLPNAINAVAVKTKEYDKNTEFKSNSNTPIKNNHLSTQTPKSGKHKSDTAHTGSPPSKITKIDDYFKRKSILKDIYGEDFRLTQSGGDKLKAVKIALVDCPVCNAKVDSKEINKHLDECLNKDVVEKLSKETIETVNFVDPKRFPDKNSLKKIVGNIPAIPAFRAKTESVPAYVKDYLDLSKRIPVQNNKISAPRESIDIKFLVDNIDKNHARKSGNYTVPKEEKQKDTILQAVKVKVEPGVSKETKSKQVCPCCGKKIDKPVHEHLEDCLGFFDNNSTIPEEGASTSYANTTIVIDDDDDIFDETLTFNATGTKSPCPCCLKMVEQAEMNKHLDVCLTS